MQYLSAPETRAMLGGICHATLHNWLKRNPDFPRPVQLMPRGPRYWRRDELEAFMERNRVS